MTLEEPGTNYVIERTSACAHQRHGNLAGYDVIYY
jgi:hypothetical protein